MPWHKNNHQIRILSGACYSLPFCFIRSLKFQLSAFHRTARTHFKWFNFKRNTNQPERDSQFKYWVCFCRNAKGRRFAHGIWSALKLALRAKCTRINKNCTKVICGTLRGTCSKLRNAHDSDSDILNLVVWTRWMVVNATHGLANEIQCSLAAGWWSAVSGNTSANKSKIENLWNSNWCIRGIANIFAATQTKTSNIKANQCASVRCNAKRQSSEAHKANGICIYHSWCAQVWNFTNYYPRWTKTTKITEIFLL